MPELERIYRSRGEQDMGSFPFQSIFHQIEPGMTRTIPLSQTQAERPAQAPEFRFHRTGQIGVVVASVLFVSTGQLRLQEASEYPLFQIPAPIIRPYLPVGVQRPGPTEMTLFTDLRDAVFDNADTDLESIQSAVNALTVATGYSRNDIANRLLGVSRTTVQNWLSGKTGITTKNRSHLFSSLEVIVKAQEKQAAHGVSVADWLVTPRGSRGITPESLILAGDFNRARIYVISASPSVQTPLIEWAKNSNYRLRDAESEVDVYYEGSDLENG